MFKGLLGRKQYIQSLGRNGAANCAGQLTPRSLLGNSGHVLQPPGRTAAGSERLAVQGSRNSSQGVNALAWTADFVQHGLRGGVGLDVLPVCAKAIAELDVPDPLAVR